MIGLYYKEGIKWLDWEDDHDYLVVRGGIIYYHGKVPDSVKDEYLMDRGVELTRTFIQRLRSGDFYLKIERWEDVICHRYRYYLGIDDFERAYQFLNGCYLRQVKHFDSYYFKHVVEGATYHYIAEGEAIAGALLEKGRISMKGYKTLVFANIDVSDTYLPKAIDEVKRIMRKNKYTTSVTWANKKIIKIEEGN
jgi:hypothetical protein